MYIKKGRDRLVVVLPRLGVVVKFPLIRILVALRVAWLYMRRPTHFVQNLRFELDLPVEHMLSGIKGALARGVVNNWREWQLYRTTNHALLEPTYFSMLGFLNVQKYDAPYSGTSQALWAQLLELTDGAVWADVHHFCNPANFCVRRGTLLMVDYGGSKGVPVILAYGDKIRESFDPTLKETEVAEMYK